MSKRKANNPNRSDGAQAKPPPEAKKSQSRDAASGPAGWFSGRGLWLVSAGLFLLVLLVFSQALNNDFVHYDDADYVTGNPHVKAGLTISGLRWAFTTGYAANWHPLTWISHMVDCQCYGLKPWGHHLTNILLHALNVTLLFIVLRKLTASNWKSLVVALLFGLHPLRVESVAWVAERKDVLSTFFWMLTVWAYVLYVEKFKARNPRFKLFYVLALLCFAFALMSKPMVVTLPFVLLLLDWWPLGRIAGWSPVSNDGKAKLTLRRLVIEKLPFFALAALASGVTFIVQQRGEVVQSHIPLGIRLANAVVAYCRYLGKLCWPTDLAVFYPHPIHWPAGLLLLCGLILLAVSGMALVFRKRRAWFAIGWLWFLGALIPAIGIVQVGAQSMADRYSYVPTIGILILIVWSGQELVKRWPESKLILAAAITTVIVECAVLTVRQIRYWKNSETLFTHALAVTTNNPVALINLGEAVASRGNADEAIAYYREAMRLEPRDFEALNNLGVQLIVKNQLNEAIDVLRHALEIDRNSPMAHNNLGQALSNTGRYDEAIAQFQEALRLRPEYAKAQHNWGLALAGKRQVDEAIEHFRLALRFDPYLFEGHRNLGIAYYVKGQYDDAILEFQAALKLVPGDSGILQNLQTVREDKAAAFEKASRGIGNKQP